MAMPRPISAVRHRRMHAILRCMVAASVLFGISAGTGAGTSAAEQPDTQDTIDLQRRLPFAIPSQPLADALDQFSRISKVQVLYGSNLASGQRSSAVEGVWPITTALQILLQGTGLVARYTSHHDVVLAPINDRSTSAPAPAPEGEAVLALRTLYVHPPTVDLASPAVRGMSYKLYGGVIRAKIKEALQRDRATGHGNYDVKMGVWVSQAGTLLRLVLLHPTGDPDRDHSIERVLDGLAFGQQPPADLPQPVTLGIQVRTP